ncbi:MAG: HlyD family efflux transporter periplasmic adaptor subunit [Saprospiraceae bacterium]|nr:HlyD family efflux transporter periplasmic adaptor subunit [Saprospiraceae bacterium]
MLNISEQSVDSQINKKNYSAFSTLTKIGKNAHDRMVKVLIVVMSTIVIILFLPWTQNVRTTGDVIARSPDQRPQTIQSVIGGRIEKWFVQEGQFVKKGDTILQISEVKDAYFDPNLLKNTQLQIDAKTFSKMSYDEKTKALSVQIEALEKGRQLKLNQAKNKILQNKLKVQSDSIELIASKINYEVANDQYVRLKGLYTEGLRSLTDLENRNLKLQETLAKYIAQENKLLTSRNELINSQIELNSIVADYSDKIAKSKSEKFTAVSDKYDAEAAINKLNNQYSSYSVRLGLYFVLAPQDGYITQARQTGLGQTIKEGESIVSIMPANYDLAIQMYVRPIDLPLFEKGQKVMIQFDGWPAVVFSGWPGISYGTYVGEVLAMDNFISENHMYRILVKPTVNNHPWPEQLRVGAGVKTITLLKNVSVWYELWRQINGFPPDYYKKGNIGNALIKENKK